MNLIAKHQIVIVIKKIKNKTNKLAQWKSKIIYNNLNKSNYNKIYQKKLYLFLKNFTKYHNQNSWLKFLHKFKFFKIIYIIAFEYIYFFKNIYLKNNLRVNLNVMGKK
jgi:hypothetical protein